MAYSYYSSISTITILKQAHSNESTNIEKEDLRYYLDTISEKIKIILNQYQEIDKKLIELSHQDSESFS